ncbi:MAG: hypothetical protein EXX96DRAFT_652512 [Benjaminiella poitrasii]|nr:MAG: hypothetical protein EXX96DRAFT_652512 [Benjaminiella poitrasii]
MPCNMYYPLPTGSIKVSIHEFEKIIDEMPEKYGVKFIFKETRTPSSIELSSSNEYQTYGRGRSSSYKWIKIYNCHRAFPKKIVNNRSVGGLSGKRRLVQKASKRIGYKAKLRAYHLKDDEQNVYIKLFDSHKHTIGSLEDMQYLPLSHGTKNKIVERLKEGFNRREIRVSLQRKFKLFIDQQFSNFGAHDNNNLEGEMGIVHQDQLVHSEEIQKSTRNSL